MHSTNVQSVVVGTLRHGAVAALLLVVAAIGGEVTLGRDLGRAVGNGLLVMIWVGWVYVLIAMGIGAVFLALLYGVVAQFTRLTWWSQSASRSWCGYASLLLFSATSSRPTV